MKKIKFKGKFKNMKSINEIRRKQIAKDLLIASSKIPLPDLFGFLISR